MLPNLTNDCRGLCQPDHRGKLLLPVSLEELYDAFKGLLIIFNQWDHSCAVEFQFHCILTIPVIWEN